MDKILIVEDDRSIAKALKRLFEPEGFALEVAPNGDRGLELFRAATPALVILDLKLPKVSGRDLCRQIKQEAPALPVIVLTAASEEIDKVLLFELGADDYVTKPFSPRELLARVRAVLRRSSRRVEPAERFSFGDVTLDFATMELTRDGKAIPLTPHEFKTLKFFAENPDRVVSREELLNEVWGYQNYPSTRTIDNHILKLRQKIEKDLANPVYFRTVHGVGYRFLPQGDKETRDGTQKKGGRR